MLPGHCFTIEVWAPVSNTSPSTRRLPTATQQPIIIEGLDPADWTFPDGWAASTEVRLTFSLYWPYLTRRPTELFKKRASGTHGLNY